MAKAKAVVNKSQAIREAFEEFPGAKAKEIVAHLKAKGIETSEQLVYQVKKVKKKKPGRKPGKAPQVKAAAPVKAKVAAPSSNGFLSVAASISVARTAAEKVGGLPALKEIVDALQ
jgi:hypothetical protein